MRALVMVDLQNDFLPGGRLAVPRGDEVIPLANALQPYFELIVATQDWHPADHLSFASQHPGHQPGDLITLEGLPQVLWPDHCVQGTPGANFPEALHTRSVHHVVRKGQDRHVDSYSGFFDNGQRHETELARYLRSHGVTDVYILGLATDYCVRATAIDAARLGFRTYLIEDACRGVELRPGDCARALEEMERAGVTRITSDQWLAVSDRAPRIPPAIAEQRKPLCEGRFVSLLRQDRWEFVERRNASGVVVIVPTTPRGEVVFVEQYRTPVGRRCIELPAGLVGDDPETENEDRIEAVKRELLEETGYSAGRIEWLGSGPPSAGLTTEIVDIYWAGQLQRVTEGGGTDSELILVHCVPWSDAPRWLSERVEEGLHVAITAYAGLWLAGQSPWVPRESSA